MCTSRFCTRVHVIPFTLPLFRGFSSLLTVRSVGTVMAVTLLNPNLCAVPNAVFEAKANLVDASIMKTQCLLDSEPAGGIM